MTATEHKNTWLFIINPKATQVEVKRIGQKLERELHHSGLHGIILVTKYKSHAISLVHEAIFSGIRQMVAVGGDGTIHEVVNGIMTQDICPSTDITLAVLPMGTGNDWANHYQIPKEISGCMQLLKQGKIAIQDVGKLNYLKDGHPVTRYFNNVAGMAYDAFVVKKLAQKHRKPNALIYLFSVFAYLMKYKLQLAHVIADDQHFEHRYYTINMGICPLSGGGMSLVPHAIPNDGKLALTLAEDLSKWDILINTYRFYNRSLLRHPKVKGFQVDRIEVQSLDEMPLLLEADGEFLGHTPVTCTLIPGALRIVIP